MRVVQTGVPTGSSLRRAIERRSSLPLRPATARLLLSRSEQTVSGRDLADLDPAWVLDRSTAERAPLARLADLDWWRRSTPARHAALQRLWRLSVGVSLAARRRAMAEGDPEFDRVADAGLLHGLGLWTVASIDPDWLVAWFEVPDLEGRRDMEVRDLGEEVDRIGRRLARRSGCDPLILDAVWLHADIDGGLNPPSRGFDRLQMIQQAYALADKSPWGFNPLKTGDFKAADPQLKILIAEVQAVAGTDFIELDANPREEALSRSNAKLRNELSNLNEGWAGRERFLEALGRSTPEDSREQWAEGVSDCFGEGAAVEWDEKSVEGERLGRPGYPSATLRLKDGTHPDLGDSILQAAWHSWTALVGSRMEEADRLGQVTQAYRKLTSTEAKRLHDAKLEALAEFAAGAGHELNNPLAVIVGRAQILLVHEKDPKIAKSLRAILTQAQRAHRILRDLMYVARPPELRPRFCRPDEIVRASLRDAKSDSDDRDVGLSAVNLEHGELVWADPDGLRHLADTLVRNALEASSKGGRIRFSSIGDGKSLRWTIQDFGRGVNAHDGPHLFDPFYCGRQAGRGLGMGLPRAARFVESSGGEIRWKSNSGEGTMFQVRLPLEPGPKPPNAENSSTSDA